MPHLPLKFISPPSLFLAIVSALALFAVLSPEALAQGFTNPLLPVTTVKGLLTNLARFLLGLVGFLAIIALIWGGILYIISLGQDKYVQQAKSIILWAIIGLTISLLSFTIMSFIQKALLTGGF